MSVLGSGARVQWLGQGHAHLSIRTATGLAPDKGAMDLLRC